MLLMQAREQDGRDASPTAGVVDSQSVKTTEAGGLRGYDAGKKINGRKRHLVTDTIGLPLNLVVMRPISKTVMDWPWPVAGSSDSFLGCTVFSPTPAIRALSLQPTQPAPGSGSRLSNDHRMPKGSR